MVYNEYYCYGRSDEIFDFQLGKARSMLQPYNLRSGYFYAWLNDFEYVARVVGIAYHKMLDFFLMMVDNEIFEMYKDLRPRCRQPSSITYDQLVEKFHYYFSVPYHVSYLHKTRFLIRYQYENETIRQFVDNLCSIYLKCEYVGPQEYDLRAQFIRGIRDTEISDALRKLRRMKFHELVRIAILLERGKDTLMTP